MRYISELYIEGELLKEGFISDKLFKVINTFNSKIQSGYKFLIKNPKFKKLSKYKSQVTSAAKKHKSAIIRSVRSNDISKIKKSIYNASEDVKKVIGESLFDFTGDGFANAVRIFVIMILLLVGTQVILGIIVGTIGAMVGASVITVQILATVLTITILAPVIEEWGKLQSAREGGAGEFLLIFNILEFTKYVGNLIAMGASPIKAIIVRLFAVAMHYTTGHIINKGVKSKDPKKEKKAYSTGVLIHAVFNALGLVFGAGISQWVFN